MVRFRPNVAAIIIKPTGHLLICERWRIPGAWQFPQGGIDPGESSDQALRREVREEVGLKPSHYEVLAWRKGYRYLYPPQTRKTKRFTHASHGQEQIYYLCRTRSHSPEIRIDRQPREFGAYRWIPPDEFDLDWLPPFKREVYRRVMWDFFGLELA